VVGLVVPSVSFWEAWVWLFGFLLTHFYIVSVVAVAIVYAFNQ